MADSRHLPPFARLNEKMLQGLANLKTPCWIVDEAGLEENGRILKQVQDRTGCRILLAQKAFSNYDFYPLLSGYLAGTEASGLYEARLGFEQMPGKEVHVFCAAYREDEMVEVIAYADHIVFNSITQLKRYGPAVKAAGKSAGLRVNPEYSTQEGHAIYDPCAPGSRMGVTRQVWDEQMDDSTLALVDGLHFHTLCEQDAEDLQTTLQAVREKFGDILSSMKWLNMGGGHHITRPGYNISLLEDCIKKAAEDWQVQVYLEPGEAVALNAGFLASRILDVVENAGVRIGILDASAACHMPDVIEMPYTPPLLQSSPDNPYVFRLAGPTCLAGDVMGKYAFEASLKPGDLLLFGDMAIYTTCKTNTFNGMPLPQVYAFKKDGSFQKLTDFGYQDFKNRLGS